MNNTIVARKNYSVSVVTLNISGHSDKEKKDFVNKVEEESSRRVEKVLQKKGSSVLDIPDLVIPISLPCKDLDKKILLHSYVDRNNKYSMSKIGHMLLDIIFGLFDVNYTSFSSKKIVSGVYSNSFKNNLFMEDNIFHTDIFKSNLYSYFSSDEDKSKERKNHHTKIQERIRLLLQNEKFQDFDEEEDFYGRIREESNSSTKLEYLNSLDQLNGIEKDNSKSLPDGISIINVQFTITELYLFLLKYALNVFGLSFSNVEMKIKEFENIVNGKISRNHYASVFNTTDNRSLNFLVSKLFRILNNNRNKDFKNTLLSLLFQIQNAKNTYMFLEAFKTVSPNFKKDNVESKYYNTKIINVTFVVQLTDIKEVLKDHVSIVADSFVTTKKHFFFDTLASSLTGFNYNDDVRYRIHSEVKTSSKDRVNYSIYFVPSILSKIYLKEISEQLFDSKIDSVFLKDLELNVTNKVNRERLEFQFDFVKDKLLCSKLRKIEDANPFIITSLNELDFSFSKHMKKYFSAEGFYCREEVSLFYPFLSKGIASYIALLFEESDDIMFLLSKMFIKDRNSSDFFPYFREFHTLLRKKQEELTKVVFTKELFSVIISTLFLAVIQYTFFVNSKSRDKDFTRNVQRIKKSFFKSDKEAMKEDVLNFVKNSKSIKAPSTPISTGYILLCRLVSDNQDIDSLEIKLREVLFTFGEELKPLLNFILLEETIKEREANLYLFKNKVRDFIHKSGQNSNFYKKVEEHLHSTTTSCSTDLIGKVIHHTFSYFILEKDEQSILAEALSEVDIKTGELRMQKIHALLTSYM